MFAFTSIGLDRLYASRKGDRAKQPVKGRPRSGEGGAAGPGLMDVNKLSRPRRYRDGSKKSGRLRSTAAMMAGVTQKLWRFDHLYDASCTTEGMAMGETILKVPLSELTTVRCGILSAPQWSRSRLALCPARCTSSS